jgi:carbon starvation protein
VSNQLLAAFALAIGTSVLINMGRARYVWCTLVPLAFMCVNTLTAGWMNLRINYLRPQLAAGAGSLLEAFARAPGPARAQCVITLVIMAMLLIVMTDSVARWVEVWRGKRARVTSAPEGMPEAVGL